MAAAFSKSVHCGEAVLDCNLWKYGHTLMQYPAIFPTHQILLSKMVLNELYYTNTYPNFSTLHSIPTHSCVRHTSDYWHSGRRCWGCALAHCGVLVDAVCVPLCETGQSWEWVFVCWEGGGQTSVCCVLSWRHDDCFLSSQLWHLSLASKCNNTTHFSRRMSACQHGTLERMCLWLCCV